MLKTFWNSLTAADKILLAILLGISLVSWIWVNQFTETGTWVQVWIENREVGQFSLLEDRMIILQGPLGETHFQIKKKRVAIIESACPNKICCQMGEIHRSGQLLVCLPNRVVIKIAGASAPVSWDVITE